jgi:hypothetical protein
MTLVPFTTKLKTLAILHFKIFEMSAIFKMAAKTRLKIWVLKIQHCLISSKFDMWVDNDVPTLKIFYRSPFSKWPPQLNFCGIVLAILKMVTGRNCSMSGINSGHHYLPTYQILMISAMLNFCGIVVAILKMATGRKFSMSGHHYLPTYQILMISADIIKI